MIYKKSGLENLFLFLMLLYAHNKKFRYIECTTTSKENYLKINKNSLSYIFKNQSKCFCYTYVVSIIFSSLVAVYIEERHQYARYRQASTPFKKKRQIHSRIIYTKQGIVYIFITKVYQQQKLNEKEKYR